jgi:surface carbohydrate biosynthesis protein (TIGR04326 family)
MLDAFEALPHADLLIWDSEEKPPEGDWIVVYWKHYLQGNGIESGMISIPQLLEENADVVKERLLTWLYELGDVAFGNKSLIERLALREGFSYWWMTRLLAKNYMQSESFHQSARLFILEDIIQEMKPYRIRLASHNKALLRVVKMLCRRCKIEYIFLKPEGRVPKTDLMRRSFFILPKFIQAVFGFMRYIWARWALIQAPQKKVLDADITCVDYLFHLDKKSFAGGVFSSHYWTSLIALLHEKNMKVNWLHHFVKHHAVPTASKAEALLSAFNTKAKGWELHDCFDAGITPRILGLACRDYIKLRWMHVRLRGVRYHFKLENSSLDLWPIFRKDWQVSMTGSSALINCVQLNLYEARCKQLPYQKLGFYLQENQPWEMAFIYAWRLAGHGKLVGVSHSTVRYWDLRYFYDPRCYVEKSRFQLPRPDQIAVNGPVAKAMYLKGGYLEEQLFEVEALRYLNLIQSKNNALCFKTSIRILICTDYLSDISRTMLSWLTETADELSSYCVFKVKPHPHYMIDVKDYPTLSLSLMDAPLSELLHDCDLVFTSNITSAAVDAYTCGLPVIQVLDGAMFNLSPLRGLDNLFYASNSSEFLMALRKALNSKPVSVEPYFCLDKALPRWEQLLDVSEAVNG